MLVLCRDAKFNVGQDSISYNYVILAAPAFGDDPCKFAVCSTLGTFKPGSPQRFRDHFPIPWSQKTSHEQLRGLVRKSK